jgi:hypothetical protein
MKTLTRVETGRDARGNKYQTKVYQDFAEMTVTSGVTSYVATQEDGVYTLSETITEEVPDPGGGGGAGFPEIWSLDVSTISEPIETNAYFRTGMSLAEMSWWARWKAGMEAAAGTPDGFPASSTNQVVQNLYQRFNRGETDYLTPRIVVKFQKVYMVPPPLTGVGRATNDIAGNPFTFSNTVNFLMTGGTALREGGTYRVTMEWLTSKPGGWDQLIYGP